MKHDVLAECGALGVSASALKIALEKDPTPSAVLMTRPSYYGLARDWKKWPRFATRGMCR